MAHKEWYWILGIHVLILCAAVWGFWGSYHDGMQFDEVFRVNNLLPLVGGEPYDQSILSYAVAGWELPISYKSYISSFSLVRYLPLLLVEDWRWGIRVLPIFYYILSLSGLVWILQSWQAMRTLWGKQYLPMIVGAVGLLAVTPVLFPEVRINFVHLTALPLVVLAMRMCSGKGPWQWWWGGLLWGLVINMEFYALWVVAAVMVATTVVYPRWWWRGWKPLLLMAGGVLLGAVHHVWYNFHTGVEVLQVLWAKWFTPHAYQAIDYKEAVPFGQELLQTFAAINGFVGGQGWWYGVLLVVMTGGLTWGWWRQHRGYGWVLCVVWATLIFILLSPNTTRPGHYIYLSPWWELGLMAVITALPWKWWKQGLVYGGLWITLMTITYGELQQQWRTGGEGHFSPVIYALHAYHQDHPGPWIFFQWGMHPQLYFLSGGVHPGVTALFPLLEKDPHGVWERWLWMASNHGGEEIAMPLYVGDHALGGNFVEEFRSWWEAQGGTMTVDRVLGAEEIVVYRLGQLAQWRAGVLAAKEPGSMVGAWTASEGPLWLTREAYFWPAVESGKGELVLWAPEDHTPEVTITWGEQQWGPIPVEGEIVVSLHNIQTPMEPVHIRSSHALPYNGQDARELAVVVVSLSW